MIYVTSDLHGYPLPDFFRLLDKARFSDADDLIVLGDVIDRNGDGGIAMLRWITQQVNVRMIMGNHEAMMLSCRFLFDFSPDRAPGQFTREEIGLLSNWLRNGADPTIEALGALFRENPECALALFDYVRDLPLYEIIDVHAGRYLLVHSGLGNFSEEKEISDYTPEELLWVRPLPGDRYFHDITTVFGHTPTKYYGAAFSGKMLKTSTWINIDTGAASGKPPMLLRLNDEQPFYQEKDPSSPLP